MTDHRPRNGHHLHNLVASLEGIAWETAGKPDSPHYPEDFTEAEARKSKLIDDKTSKELIAHASQLTAAVDILEPMLAANGPAAFDAMFDVIEGAAGIGLLARGSPGEKLREALREKYENNALSARGNIARKDKALARTKIIRELATPYIGKFKSASAIENKIRPALDKHFGRRKAPGRTTVMDAIQPLLKSD